jgi:hypothetical protein
MTFQPCKVVSALRLQGFLRKGKGFDYDAFLFVDSAHAPLAVVLRGLISNRQVTVRYWITDEQCSKEEAVESLVMRLHGLAECKFDSHYSELTGYLWTDEEVKVGGHDLIRELESFVGMYLTLEVDVYE